MIMVLAPTKRKSEARAEARRKKDEQKAAPAAAAEESAPAETAEAPAES